MNTKKKLFAVSLGTALVTALTFGVHLVQNGSIASATCDHEGNHYSAQEATCQKAGNQEFWACCKCHEQFLEQPAGEWSAAKALEEELASTHVAYIAPVDHSYGPSASVIGHYECKWCHDEGEQIMTTTDIPTFTTDMFGANGQRLASASTDTDATTGNKFARMGALVYSAITGKTIKFPKVNYSLYDTVSFSCSIDHYNSDSLSTSLKIGEEDFAPWSFLKGAYNVFIRVRNNISNLVIELEKPKTTGSKRTFVLDDVDVLNGTKALELIPTSESRCMYINGIDLQQMGNKIAGTQLTNASGTANDKIAVSQHVGEVGGVNGSFFKAALTTGGSATYARVNAGFGEVAYSASTANLAVRMYIECADTSETKSTIIVMDADRTGWSAGNANWCVLSSDVVHNKWVTITFPTERIGKNNVLDNFLFYANGGVADRIYYIEYIKFYSNEPTKVAAIPNETMTWSQQCTASGGSNLGNDFGGATLSPAADNNGLGADAFKLTFGGSRTYVLDRFDMAAKLEVGLRTNITFKLYLEASGEVTGTNKFILCPDNSTSGSQQIAFDNSKTNQWIDVTFTNLKNCSDGGMLSHFYFGVWEGGFTNVTAIYFASITIA